MPTINKGRKPSISKHKSGESSKYYNSKWWKRLRHSYITNHPLCEECAKEGRSTPAEEVHHVIPFLTGNTDEERWDLLLDPDNLESLCLDCHQKIHGKKVQLYPVL